MTATVTLRAPGSVDVARLPLSAVFDRGAGPKVFVVEPSTNALGRAAVTIAGYTSDAALVSSGVANGDKVWPWAPRP